MITLEFLQIEEMDSYTNSELITNDQFAPNGVVEMQVII